MHDHALVPANPMAGALGASPGIGALLARASTPTVVAASAGQPPAMWASVHAGMRATRVPGAQRSSQAANCWELPRLVITRGGQGLRPAPAGPGRLRYGDEGLRKPARGTAILAAAAWRCLDHLVCSLCRDVV